MPHGSPSLGDSLRQGLRSGNTRTAWLQRRPVQCTFSPPHFPLKSGHVQGNKSGKSGAKWWSRLDEEITDPISMGDIVVPCKHWTMKCPPAIIRHER